MKIPLAAMVRRSSNRRRTITMRPIVTTSVQSDRLARIYTPVMNRWQTGVRDLIIPAYERTLAEYMRDSVSDIQTAIQIIENSVVQVLLDFSSLFSQWAIDLQLWHMRKFIAGIKYATNVDLLTLIGPEDARITLQEALARNVALVRDISDQARGRISDAVFRGLQNRTPVRDVAREINEAIGLGRKRAIRIASDQTVKLAASLDRERQLQMGMTSFEWRHSGKAHPRPDHVTRDGKVFEWASQVGREDPPGFLPFCGCKAKGVLNLDD